MVNEDWLFEYLRKLGASEEDLTKEQQKLDKQKDEALIKRVSQIQNKEAAN
jgi:hypothetical protein